jgi:hypothetical protein
MKIKEKPIQIGSGLPCGFLWVFKTGTVPHPPPHAWLQARPLAGTTWATHGSQKFGTPNSCDC